MAENTPSMPNDETCRHGITPLEICTVCMSAVIKDRETVGADWHALGAKAMRRVKGGRAAWRLRAPRSSHEDWVIEAPHCPYLGQHPYNLGDDAWRVSIQHHDVERDVWVEVGFMTAISEAGAFGAVCYFADLADQQNGSGEGDR